MSWIWLGLVGLSVLFGCLNGCLSQVSGAAVKGASEAVELCIGMAGPLCLWTGVVEVLRRSGGMKLLAQGLRPILIRLYPQSRGDEEVMEALSANTTANLLGLGNAATPMGIRAAKGMAANCGGEGSDDLCMLVVCNSASIQLLPTTVAAVRSSAGCETPMDILPAVWLTSLCSVLAGIGAAKLLSKLWRAKKWH